MSRTNFSAAGHQEHNISAFSDPSRSAVADGELGANRADVDSALALAVSLQDYLDGAQTRFSHFFNSYMQVKSKP